MIQSHSAPGSGSIQDCAHSGAAAASWLIRVPYPWAWVRNPLPASERDGPVNARSALTGLRLAGDVR